VSGPVVPLHPAADFTVAAESALTAVHRHLDRCKLSANTVKAYKRQATAYVTWLTDRSATTATRSPIWSAPRAPSPPGGGT
jgi:integrase/recombinase XerC